MAFALDPRLAADTIFVGKLSLCEMRLMNDARYVWVVLVPCIEGAVEWHDLGAEEGTAVWSEVREVARLIGDLDHIEKVNIGALGNMVRQLHVHIVGRHQGDPAWPGPVWGHSPRVEYSDARLGDVITDLRARLGVANTKSPMKKLT